MKHFEFTHWQIWQGTADIMLSDRNSDELRYFKTTDDCVNWLYLNGHQDVARAFNQHLKTA